MKRSERLEQEFERQALALLHGIGAKPATAPDHLWYPLQLDTSAGPLFFIVRGANVFGRFAWPQRAAAAGTGCNPASGKWNNHFCDLHSAADVRQRLNQLGRGLEWLLHTLAA